ncbi:hypothetical protein ACMUMS_16920 [Acinetobacter courvalinii]|uniref:hypothetical protein n=1 Tax=Acinetobacter courvalinii TaxID=280147 RepID=UPI003A89FF7E
MRKLNMSHSIFITIVLGGVLMCVGCETEQAQSTPKNNNGMVGYAKMRAEEQAELTNQEYLKKYPLPQNKTGFDGTKQTVNLRE